VLLRCGLPRDGTSPTRSTAVQSPTADASLSATPSGAAVAPDAEHTLMETYALAPSVDAAAFLAALDAAATPLAALLRGARHTELFTPCAS